MRTNTTDTAKAITTWIKGHEYFKWGAMCDKVGLDKANFHRTLASDTPRIKEEYITKIIEEIREYGYKDAEDKADEKLKEEVANDQEFTEILEDINTVPLPADYINPKSIGIIHPDGRVEKIKFPKKGKKNGKVIVTDLSTPSKGKTKDLNEKKKTNYSIPDAAARIRAIKDKKNAKKR